MSNQTDALFSIADWTARRKKGWSNNVRAPFGELVEGPPENGPLTERFNLN